MEKKIIDYVIKQIRETPEILHQKTINSQGQLYLTRTLYVRLKQHIDNFLKLKDNNVIRWVVIPGLRGTGKSTILAQVYVKLLSTRKDVNTLFFSLDEVVTTIGSNLQEVLNAYEQVLDDSLSTSKKPLFIFLDEVHYDPGWFNVIKVLIDKNPNIFILATGSSAILLASSADVQRRMRVEKLYPMSFCEFALVNYRIFPTRNLKESINKAMFDSPDAKTAYIKLKQLEPEVKKYWKTIKASDNNALAKYFNVGTLPFTQMYGTNTNAAYDAIFRTVRTIIDLDLPKIGQFTKKTIDTVLQLLSVLAISSAVSLRKFSEVIEMDTSTITDILEALVKAELLVRVYPPGAAVRSVRKPSRYFFMSPAIRAAILNVRGGKIMVQEHRGDLFEDLVAMYLYKRFVSEGRGKVIYYDTPEKTGPDFVVIPVPGCNIPIEAGLGKKSTKQIWPVMQKYNSPYGLIISSSDLNVIQDKVVMVPLYYFLLAI